MNTDHLPDYPLLTGIATPRDNSQGLNGCKPTTEIPDMVLVPRVPTQEMLDAAWADAHGEDAEGMWREMIAAWEARDVSNK